MRLTARVLKTFSVNRDIPAQKSSTCKRIAIGFVEEKFLCFLHEHITSADISIKLFSYKKRNKTN